MDTNAPSAIDADIAKLEAMLRQLKVQYDMFFAGGLKQEPTELRAAVEQLIKRYANSPIQKYAQSFHLNALTSRYTAMSEMWNRALRSQETGERRNPLIAERKDAPRDGVLAAVTVQQGGAEERALRGLYTKLLGARKRLGEEKPLSFESFLRGVRSQSERLRAKSGCAEIELRLVVKDNKAQLVARRAR